MARQPRLHLAGGLYHVILRGNARQDIFFDDEDRHRFYWLIEQGVKRFGYRVHAFCCMTNHVHLAVQVSEAPLSRGMHNLAFRYTRWINHRQQRVGHLFQGRYKAILVDADSYLLELVRYIHLNPVRARLVDDPTRYPWSSQRAYVGHEAIPWLTTDWVLSQFGQRASVARRAYQRFVAEGQAEGYREEFHRGTDDSRLLGEDSFVQRILGKRESRALRPPAVRTLVHAVCRAYEVKEDQLASASRQRWLAEARGLIAWLALNHGSATLTELAGRFNRDVSALSLAVRRIEAQCNESSSFRARVEKLNNSITQA
jgi:REP element-mobilizing transposase RayT